VTLDLDLQQDAADVYAYVASRVTAYSPDGDRGPGGSGLVKMVYAGYEFDQAGWFALVFDRRPDAGHDGEWTLYLHGNMLSRPGWLKARERNEAWPIEVRREDGSVRKMPPRSEFSQLLGQMLVGVLQRAERDGLFACLPRAAGFWLGLEEFNGSLGWDSHRGYGGEPEQYEA
jgi:hypothetical protein